MYTCPVCFFDGLRYPPADYTICPCCYTEFGLDDAEVSHEQLRRIWIDNGLPWMAANVMPPPPGWDGARQLFAAGVGYEITTPSAEPEVAIVDLGRRQVTITVDGSFTAEVRERVVAFGRSVPNLLASIHSVPA